MKILLSVDGSETSKRMLSYIAAHDELQVGDHDHVYIHVTAEIPQYVAGFLDRATVDAYYRERADAVLATVASFARQLGWRHEVTHRHGSAAAEIVECAKTEGVDLIVMGTHGHTALGSMVLGSVASGVLARCKIPVLLVH
jgi:nucleotide-binding universal stress UspA family protein